ncbi:MAG TPA: siderophore-interacting protein [Steroidobacteraceae bacterium]|nr:siderophore-interacting protein [Steroidobacteraceae bacterium]
MIDSPVVRRVRHELRRRTLTVTQVRPQAAGLLRVVFGGEQLAGFTSLGFDDHVKLFFPDGAGGEARRDFTPRRHDAAANELWIDFHLHDEGPAARWAAGATVGQSLDVGGPKGSSIVEPAGIDLHLFVGDETALPAIARRLEELPATARALVVLETASDVQQALSSGNPSLRIVWIAKARGPADGGVLIDVLRGLELPERCFAWVAHESKVARAIRRHLVDVRGFDPGWVKAAGYWQRGAAGTHDHLADADRAMEPATT